MSPWSRGWWPGFCHSVPRSRWTGEGIDCYEYWLPSYPPGLLLVSPAPTVCDIRCPWFLSLSDVLSSVLCFCSWPCGLLKKSYSPCLLSILYTFVALSHSSIFLLLESLSWRIYIFIPFLCKDVHNSRSSRFLLSLYHKPSIWLWTLVIRLKHYNMCKMLRSMTDTVINVSFIIITSLSS